MSPNDADGMANSVDPDQTAPVGAVWSGSALFAQAYLSENLGSLRYVLTQDVIYMIIMTWTNKVCLFVIHQHSLKMIYFFWPIRSFMLLIMKCKNRKYYKVPKVLDTPKIAVIILKFEQCGSTIE